MPILIQGIICSRATAKSFEVNEGNLNVYYPKFQKEELKTYHFLRVTSPYIVNEQDTVLIKGKVRDKSGAPLVGVSIIIKGTSKGTTTDYNGNYSITAKRNQTLVYSFVGYKKKFVIVGNQTVVNIVMEESISNLNEVVVVGYGVQKKATLTGSISEIKGKVLKESPQPNLSNSLAGKFSGIIANNRSGEPGYDASQISIRGLATTGNNNVLVVIDGVAGELGGLDRLDPNNIASITVLKDASAAIYGSRAANGVILVTTKRGKVGKPTLSFSSNYGLSSPTRLPKMADAATYATIMNEINYYNNPSGGYYQFYSEAEIEKFRNGSDPLNYPNTNWEAETLKKSTPQIKNYLSLTGGTDKTKYFVSFGELSQDGLYKKGATKYKQYDIRSNIDADITKRLKISIDVAARKEHRQYPVVSAGNIFRSIYRAYPTVAARFPNGLPSTGIENNNPIIMVTSTGGINDNPKYILNTILKASYEIPGIKGLIIDGFYSGNNSWSFSKTFSKPYPLYSYDKTSDTYTKVITGGSAGKATLYESQDNISLITYNAKLNYSHRWNKHHFKAFISYEQSKRQQKKFSATAYNFPTPTLPELSQGGSAPTDKKISGWSSIYSRRSYLGRISYNYAEKYILETQMRVDGSSIFPPGKRYGYFPSISGGWIISKEPWFNNIKFVNNLKIRVSYGELGNDNIPPFQYFTNYSFNNMYVIGSTIHEGIDLTKIANPAITWEVAKKLDIGINALLWKGLSLEGIYFYQKRSNILEPRNASIPQVSGIVNESAWWWTEPIVPYENIGKVENRGFEATISYKHSGKISYNISANITDAKSKIIFIDEAAGLLPYQRQTGKPLNTYLLYRAIGIFRTQEDLNNYPHLPGNQLGDLIYQDINHDGKITAEDRIRTKYGNIPEITFGLNLSVNWKNFDLSLFFAGQTRVSQYVLPESGTVGNFYSSWADNRWSVNNPNGTYPRVDTRASSSINGGLYPNTFWLNDASFIRLKTMELGYTISSTYLNNLKIQYIKVYISGFNLFTLTKVADYDPEGNNWEGQFYPQQRIMNLGVNVKF